MVSTKYIKKKTWQSKYLNSIFSLETPTDYINLNSCKIPFVRCTILSCQPQLNHKWLKFLGTAHFKLSLCILHCSGGVSSCQSNCKVLLVFVFVFVFVFVYVFVFVKLVYSVSRLHAPGVCLAPVQFKLDQNNPRGSRGGESFDKFFKKKTFQHNTILSVKT